ncbi:Gfo/Idh/MocA family protein [Gracilibacillus dipsosauri]|uniref:Gfo/Idh/MocA family oxidoreductase n=1 Tax=Gracilibacillus dipsosauri TaxID=178340 RepID=A0A317KWW8_9BACI|nr:Gfo/Idh/MocA family oxidoreductase [Gracilibacillus dipsosauri]PWU68001.1 gfo/Idh/MocA family oxidoreductase [Gracilibacillus dipsosauri]
MLNVALLSRWHVHADDYAQQAKANDGINISAVWDEDLERGKKWADELDVPFYEDLDELLSQSDIDGVIVDTPTNMHKDVIMKAAKNKKHIFTEKVLAITVSDYQEIVATIEEAGVVLMVSLPKLTDDYYLRAQKVLDDGTLGKLTTIRCRFAHNGAVPSKNSATGWLPAHFFDKVQCGGGALIDLGAHPIYLTNRLAGPARSLSAMLQSTSDQYDVDDNSVVLVEYESGAIGILETSFLSSGSPFQLELYGTEGTLLVEEQSVRLKTDTDWVDVTDTVYEPMPMEQWVHAINKTAEPSLKAEDFYHLTLINQAAAQSNETGERVLLDKVANN